MARAACRVVEQGAAATEVLGLAAYVLVASRYNGGEPVLVAAPAPGDDERALVLWSSGTWDDQQTTVDFLDRLHEEIDQSRLHQPCLLEDVAPGLGLDGARHADTFLQLAYVCQSAESAKSAPAASSTWPFLADTKAVRLRVVPRDGELQFEVSASAAAYPSGLMPQLSGHIARAAEWLANNPREPLSEFPLLSLDERSEITNGFNGAHVPVPAGLTLHGLIAAQTARTPEATAVVYGDVALSYQQLDGQANHLATILRRDYRVTTGARVGVMMDRSDQSVVALCGVMKAGAAYVPINPRHPWETVRYMIEDAGVTVLIVNSESIAAAASFAGDLLVIDIELRGLLQSAALPQTATETDLAYVIFTSGSTGRPKGVAVEHRAVVNTILWRNDFYEIGPSDINLQIPSFSFDSSVVDIFCVLTVGGTLVVPSEDLRLDARALIDLSVARGVTSCIVTPSYYRLLLTELVGAIPSLRWVTLAGETATPELVAAHLEALPGVKLFNEYGPTENAVCSTACRLEVAESTVSIGRPIWNVTVVILDAVRRLVPIGVPGEIHLGGAGLARGYVNQETLTMERFVQGADPLASDRVLYRTGDRACWRPDGSLEFLGRLDGQVKVRGIRIELDEVEQALGLHPGVRSAAVICKKDSGGSNYLSAYAEGQPGLTRADLREHMHARLPSYMVPDAFSVMSQLPLNLNGKIDRATLAGIDDFAGHSEEEEAPLSPVQSRLTALWADVLKRSQVALDDNFFAMGGNSLRVMELTSRIRGELALGVELLDVYTYPTVRELAGRLAQVNQ